MRMRLCRFVSRQPKMRPYPLHVAVFRNRSDIVRFLLSKGSAVHSACESCVDPLDSAGADPTLRNYRKETAMDIAVR